MNQKRLTSINFIVNYGVGTIRLANGDFRDTIVVGYFKLYGFSFMLHHDMEGDYFMISECSTGAFIADISMDSMDEMILKGYSIIESRRYELYTAIKRTLVKGRYNLLKRNTTNIQTLCLTLTQLP